MTSALAFAFFALAPAQPAGEPQPPPPPVGEGDFPKRDAQRDNAWPYEDDLEKLSPSDRDEELNFVEKHYPFLMNSQLSEAVDENMVPFFFGGCLFCCAGNVWLPAICAGSAPRGYYEDALLSWGFHMLGIAVMYFALGIISGIWPAAASVTTAILMIFTLANCFYLMPVAAINAYDRAEKRRLRALEPPRPEQMPAVRKRERTPAAPKRRPRPTPRAGEPEGEAGIFPKPPPLDDEAEDPVGPVDPDDAFGGDDGQSEDGEKLQEPAPTAPGQPVPPPPPVDPSDAAGLEMRF